MNLEDKLRVELRGIYRCSDKCEDCTTYELCKDGIVKIRSLFLSDLPTEKDYKRNWEDEPIGALHGYKKCLKTIKERWGEG
jgi:hypothetical protein